MTATGAALENAQTRDDLMAAVDLVRQEHAQAMTGITEDRAAPIETPEPAQLQCDQYCHRMFFSKPEEGRQVRKKPRVPRASPVGP